MSDTHITDDAFINSIIGEGTRFKGEFDLNGLLRIDGDFTGVIRTKGKVLVGKNGRAECTLNAGTVVVGGVLRGEIFSTEKVIILSTGLVLGNITTPRLIIEEGVIFNGSCKITTPAAPEPARPARQRPEIRGRAPQKEAVAAQRPEALSRRSPWRASILSARPSSIPFPRRRRRARRRRRIGRAFSQLVESAAESGEAVRRGPRRADSRRGSRGAPRRRIHLG